MMGLRLLCIRMVDWLIFDKCCAIISLKKTQAGIIPSGPFSWRG